MAGAPISDLQKAIAATRDIEPTSFESEAMAAELVARLGRVIDLAEGSCIDSATNQQKVAEAREALAEVAAFFEVDVPEAKPVRRT